MKRIWPFFAGLVSCGGGAAPGVDGAPAVDYGTLVFEEEFEEVPDGSPLGRWIATDQMLIELTYGNPAPSASILRGQFRSVEQLVFANQPVTFTADVDIVPFDVGVSQTDLFLSNGLGLKPLPVVHVTVVNNSVEGRPKVGYPAGITTLISCDESQVPTLADVGTSDVFRTIYYRIDASGMHCGIDGTDYFTDPSRPMISATAGPVFNFRSNIGSISSTATINIDNIRVYRGDP